MGREREREGERQCEKERGLGVLWGFRIKSLRLRVWDS